jgi:hypothetical protein
MEEIGERRVFPNGGLVIHRQPSEEPYLRRVPSMTTPSRPNPPENHGTATGQGAAVVGRDARDVTTNVTNIHLHSTVAPGPDGWLHQLPSPLSEKQFVGRGVERAQIKRILNAANSGKVALTALKGMGGIGKTALAVFVANQIKGRFPDGQLYIQLYGTTANPTPPNKVMEYVIQALQPGGTAPPTDSDALIGAYRSVLAGKKILLLLDNAKDAIQVRPLLPPTGCGLIVTSRDSLASMTEVETLAVGDLSQEESVKLLRTIVQNKGEESELQVVAKLCGYLPLALNVAASVFKRPEWSALEYIAALKTERLKRLKVGDDETKDVEAVLALSAAQLVRDDPALAAQWQMLSVFPADFAVDAGAVVLAAESSDAKDALSRLLDRHLVLFDENNCRYRLHDLFREIASNTFDCGAQHTLGTDSKQRLENAARRHAEYYLKIYQQVNSWLEKPETRLQGMNWLRTDFVNVSAAMLWSGSRSKTDSQAASVATSLVISQLNTMKHLLNAVETSSDLKETDRKAVADHPMMGIGIWMAAVSDALSGDLPSAIRRAEHALRLLEPQQHAFVPQIIEALALWRATLSTSSPPEAH